MTMMKVNSTGKKGTELEHVKTGTKYQTDAPIDNNGKGATFSPTDLVASALASCMITLMDIVSEKNGFELGHCEAQVEKIMGSSPRRISAIQIRLMFDGQAFNNKQKKLLQNAALNCPVAKSLHPELNQEVTFEFN